MEHKLGQMYRGPIGRLAQPVVDRLRGRGLGARSEVVRKVHRALWRATRSNRVLIDGHDMQVDRRDSLALAKGWYELEETEWYRANVNPGDYVVEAGANIGYFTLMLARLVGEEGHVRAYEPDPDLRAILERNLRVNGYRNVTVRPVAVADGPAELTFYRAVKNQGDNRLFSHGTDGASFPVVAVAMDDDLPEGRRIDLLKIDIQGAEPLAFAGLERTLASAPPRVIMMEFWPHGIAGMGQDPAALIERLADAGYDIRELSTDAAFDIEAASRELTPENERWVNLVLRHRDA